MKAGSTTDIPGVVPFGITSGTSLTCRDELACDLRLSNAAHTRENERVPLQRAVKVEIFESNEDFDPSVEGVNGRRANFQLDDRAGRQRDRYYKVLITGYIIHKSTYREGMSGRFRHLGVESVPLYPISRLLSLA